MNTRQINFKKNVAGSVFFSNETKSSMVLKLRGCEQNEKLLGTKFQMTMIKKAWRSPLTSYYLFLNKC